MASAPVRAKQSDQPLARSWAPFASPERRTLVLCLLLVAFTLVLYNRATHFSFINYDDRSYVYENVHVRAGLSRNTIWWALTSLDEANWHPLTWMSHALDCQLFHLNPAGHHFTSILLHGLNGVLLFLLLARSTGRVGRSFFVATLFALHPMNVESVVWIAERKNVLSTTFFFLTLAAYAWYALKPGWKRYLAVAGLLACGLASKPMLVTTPFVLLLLDYWPLGRIEGWTTASDTLAIRQSRVGRLILEKLPLLVLVAASSMVTLRAQRAAGALGLSPPFSERLKNGIYSYATYLWKAICPENLTLFYTYAGHSLSLGKVFLAAALLIAITWFVLKRRSRGHLLLGWLWFGSCDRSGASGQSSHGRQVCLHSSNRRFCNGCLGCGGHRRGKKVRAWPVRGPCVLCCPGAIDHHLSAGRILARHRNGLEPRAPSHRAQLRS